MFPFSLGAKDLVLKDFNPPHVFSTIYRNLQCSTVHPIAYKKIFQPSATASPQSPPVWKLGSYFTDFDVYFLLYFLSFKGG